MHTAYRLKDGMIGKSTIKTRYIFMKKRSNNFCISPITSYGGMGDAYIYKRSFLGQRLKRYPLSSVVRPCTTLDNEFDEISNSLLHRTTSIRGRSKASAVFGAAAEKHRRSRAAAAKRYKRKER